MINIRRIVLVFLAAVFVSSASFAHATEPIIWSVQEAEQQDKARENDQTDTPESKDSQSAEEADEQAEDNLGQDQQADEDSDKEDRSASRIRRRRNQSKQFSKRADDLVKTFSPLVASTVNAVVEVTDGKRQVAFGTVIDAGGLILTKASELRGNLTCRLVDGQELAARVVGIDELTDLALLRIDADELSAAPWSDREAPQVGSWLVNVDQSNLPFAIGIVSHNQRKIANSKAMIGIYLQERESGGVRITRVSANSPADDAGLMVNDVILGVDDVDTPTHEELKDKLAEFEPGDEIKLKLERDKKIIEVKLTLSSESKISPMSARGSPQDRMGSSLSRRRRNFPLALQHDSALNANQCGGPIVDLSGRVVGVNIARDGRVSSLALPIEIVLPAIERLKSGELSPAVINKVEIAAIDQLLDEIKKSFGDLPERRNKAEIARSAAVAQQEELERMKRDIEDRLEKVRQENKPVIEKAERLSQEMKDLEKQRQRLDADRKRLATGVR